MAKKYTNFRIGGSPSKVTDDYTVWTNDLLQRVIAQATLTRLSLPPPVALPMGSVLVL